MYWCVHPFLPQINWGVTCCSHVEYGYLPKVGAGLEGGEDGPALGVDHLEPASCADVHLLPNLAYTEWTYRLSLVRLTNLKRYMHTNKKNCTINKTLK